uniref:uncharacterized protein LOC122585074 n=1 Tax=Erigeron canadensis TaxID=72917 RepID=UPI001CB8CE85|nr:uncharacterized protein LOC122585074 [Erigeron canadensis]
MAESQVTTDNNNNKVEDNNLIQVAAEMKPWEQHSAVISIPRYDYKAPASFVHRSFSGFLITCPIKREKSATKEAMSMLDKYLTNMCSSEGEKDPENVVPKRRKVDVSEKKECTGVIEKKNLDNNNGASEVSEDSCIYSSKQDAIATRADPLSLVKLTRSGLILLTFSHDHCPNVVDIVSNIMQSLEFGSSKAPLWCHRILPIQTTCVLQEKELCALVSKLVADFMKNEGKELARPIKFAIGYNRRGIEETELKGANGDLNQVALLDRSRCFEVVASAVKNIVSDSVVDLKCPELTVLIELLPISGLPKGSPVVAVSVLPQKLIMTKPRLGIKALVHDTKSKK